jgi:hypothetical protein
VQPNPRVVVRCASAPGLLAVACEKPICCSLAEADAMVGACREHGVHFAAGDACRNYRAVRAEPRALCGSAPRIMQVPREENLETIILVGANPRGGAGRGGADVGGLATRPGRCYR